MCHRLDIRALVTFEFSLFLVLHVFPVVFIVRADLECAATGFAAPPSVHLLSVLFFPVPVQVVS